MMSSFCKLLSVVSCLHFVNMLPAQNLSDAGASPQIIPGAERMSVYLPKLKGKRIAIYSNHTSMVQNIHLVDTLVRRGVRIQKIFSPEHGFRGTADAGEKIENLVDKGTGIKIISLYGKKRKPSADDLNDVDILLFDIQDVGARFYTYISSLQEFMEASIEHNKPLIVLDRPNPNGFYVDGPVLDKKFKSFIGMQPVPIIYGMTIGEYAKMLVGEKWLELNATLKKRKLNLTVIPCSNYTHNSKYVLPVKPSPNLPEIQSTYLYPSTCFFEGTALNEGRGTDKPFQIFGHPSLPSHLYTFTPTSREGAKNPKLLNKICYGWNLHGTPQEVLDRVNYRIQLKWLIEAYQLFPQKDSFFLGNGIFFNKLAGNDVLIEQIKDEIPESAIRKSWEPALIRFKQIRKKYLLYKDF